MDETTVSSKYQVTIPKSAREKLSLRPGQKLMVIANGGVILLVPLSPLADPQRLVKGIDRRGLPEEALE